MHGCTDRPSIRRSTPSAVCGIGVNIRSGLSEHCVISLALPLLRFHEHLDGLKAALLQCRPEFEAVIRG